MPKDLLILIQKTANKYAHSLKGRGETNCYHDLEIQQSATETKSRNWKAKCASNPRPKYFIIQELMPTMIRIDDKVCNPQGPGTPIVLPIQEESLP